MTGTFREIGVIKVIRKIRSKLRLKGVDEIREI